MHSQVVQRTSLHGYPYLEVAVAVLNDLLLVVIENKTRPDESVKLG